MGFLAQWITREILVEWERAKQVRDIERAIEHINSVPLRYREICAMRLLILSTALVLSSVLCWLLLVGE